MNIKFLLYIKINFYSSSEVFIGIIGSKYIRINLFVIFFFSVSDNTIFYYWEYDIREPVYLYIVTDFEMEMQ